MAKPEVLWPAAALLGAAVGIAFHVAGYAWQTMPAWALPITLIGIFVAPYLLALVSAVSALANWRRPVARTKAIAFLLAALAWGAATIVGAQLELRF